MIFIVFNLWLALRWAGWGMLCLTTRYFVVRAQSGNFNSLIAMCHAGNGNAFT